ncbi:Rpn family recombination-promoting nuclease/putative transposase [Parafilimonas sp.]|uniref:Rpn family recombination-promoting nuclease/putative transposase n=1 Tax=Parafilimonas sp. TaxID=1969739 RepID=UPI0039E61C09
MFTITQLPDTYLSEELKKTMSDIVYSCNRKGRNNAVKLSLLIEHKNYPDKYTPIQRAAVACYPFAALPWQRQMAIPHFSRPF